MGYLKPLRIAVGVDISMTEVADLTSLSKPTLSRLWDRPDWTDHCEVATLNQLAVTIPGIGDYVRDLGYRRNLAAALNEAARVGVDINEASLQHLCRTAPLAVVAAIVRAAGDLTARQSERAFRRIGLTWGGG